MDSNKKLKCGRDDDSCGNSRFDIPLFMVEGFKDFLHWSSKVFEIVGKFKRMLFPYFSEQFYTTNDKTGDENPVNTDE